MSNPVEFAHSLMLRHEEEPAHVEHVTKLSLQLFDQVAGHVSLDVDQRQLLEAASLLHDVGHTFSPDAKAHHIHSERFVLDQPWPDWGQPKIRACASIARHHRKNVPEKFWEQSGISSKEGERILPLIAILRVADALDRSHAQRVGEVKLRFKNKIWELHIQPGPPSDVERYGFNKKCDVWVSALGPITLH